MSRLSDIIAQLESGGGTQNASQPPSMVNPTYGQYSGFANQYGSGAAGVDNYANQFLAANPNATLGDYYANYVGSTGNPSNPQYSLSNWPSIPGSQGSYYNLVNNAGVPATTPLASLLGTPASSGPLVAEGYGTSTVTAADPSTFYLPGTSTALAGGAATDPYSVAAAGTGTTPLGGDLSGSPTYDYGLAAPAGAAQTGGGGAGIPLTVGAQPGLLSTATGWVNSIIQGFTGTAQRMLGAAFGAVGNWFIRAFLIVIGLALVIVALRAILASGEQRPVNVAVTGGGRQLRRGLPGGAATEVAEAV